MQTEPSQIQPECRKIRRSREDWFDIIGRFEQSGLTQKQFCRQNGIALSSFSKWRQKLGSAPPPFMELIASPESTEDADSDRSPWLVELDLGTGMILRIGREA